MRLAFFHDYIGAAGGGENLVLMLARVHADFPLSHQLIAAAPGQAPDPWKRRRWRRLTEIIYFNCFIIIYPCKI